MPAVSAASGAAAAKNDPANARAACAALQGSLAESAAGLKLDGAVVDSATFVQAGSTASCKLTGSAALGEAGSAPIRFQISVPSDWNRHAVQFLDGMEAPQSLVDPQAAVAAGYMSYGVAGGGLSAGSAGMVDERAVAAQKKVYDAAQEIMARRFSRLSDRVYLVSGSADTTALELVKRDPYIFRGLLMDATGPAGPFLDRKPAEPMQGASAAAPTAAFDAKSAAAAVASFLSASGKLVVLAPASFPATLSGLGLPAPTASAPASVPGAAPEPAVLMAYRNLFERAGTRYVEASIQVYPLPAGEARAAEKEKVDWMPVLVDFAESGKAPPPLAQLPARR